MVALKVQKYRHPTVRLHARRPDERDARSNHPLVSNVEIINLQEAAEATSELSAYDLLLVIADCVNAE